MQILDYLISNTLFDKACEELLIGFVILTKENTEFNNIYPLIKNIPDKPGFFIPFSPKEHILDQNIIKQATIQLIKESEFNESRKEEMISILQEILWDKILP